PRCAREEKGESRQETRRRGDWEIRVTELQQIAVRINVSLSPCLCVSLLAASGGPTPSPAFRYLAPCFYFCADFFGRIACGKGKWMKGHESMAKRWRAEK